ncbi:MAG: nucleotide sugar dehydrogenase, partial [Candidatus Woesearchaeota archaeon]|nr:nucleotide sugar dehydrogenase [Candidatus Woesearchaeota archaeon]
MTSETVAVLGLGYVGLPLAIALAKHMHVIGYDANQKKIALLKQGTDYTGDIGDDAIKNSTMTPTSDPENLKKASAIIVAVPTPVTRYKVPNLEAIISAGTVIGKNLQKGTVVVLESTVYPGATEEVFAQAIQRQTQLQRRTDWFLGYSPERINPGDHEHTLASVVKVIAGETPEVTERMAQIYAKVCLAGLHRAPSIKVAEMAKVIENTQRDLNIALVNELSQIASREGIDIKDVLDAAGTKWNFGRYTPGLVGGHCLPEDPYYLALRAISKGIIPRIILAGRQVNDAMPSEVVKYIIKGFNQAGKVPRESTLAILGLTFKENVNDYRHSGAKDVIAGLNEYAVKQMGCDPYLSNDAVLREFGISSFKDSIGFPSF